MPGYGSDQPLKSDRALERQPVHAAAPSGFSSIERICVRQLIGHTLARVEREFILQTLRLHRGNRTRAADLLGISVRCLRNKIRDYKNQGEDVPEPASPYAQPEQSFAALQL